MSVPKGKLVTIDIGSSWTKVFVIDHDRGNKLAIGGSYSLPTSSGDLKLSIEEIFQKLKIIPKENVLLFSSSFEEADSLASDYKGIFVPLAEIKKNLGVWLKQQGYPNCKFFDAGSDIFKADYKVNELGAFLSFSFGEIDLENHLANRAMHFHTLAETQKEMETDRAVIRSALAKLEDSLNEASNVLMTGALVAAQTKFSKLALVMLDVLSPHKVAEVLVDTKNFANSWGAAITKYKELLDFEIDFVEKLGSFVSLGGEGTVGLDYGLKNVQEVKVAENEIALIPANEEQEVQVEFSIGKEKRKVETGGGHYGILLDGRKKPLPLIFGQSSSQKAMLKWEEAIEKVELIK
ncbi:MAG: hypothetical protein Q8P13_02015 [bacterium]|nr:hypothetical protein [bacterium]